MSNGDLIRAMSDEELAEWLIKRAYFCSDPKRFCADEPCGPCVVAWLKSPADKEEVL